VTVYVYRTLRSLLLFALGLILLLLPYPALEAQEEREGEAPSTIVITAEAPETAASPGTRVIDVEAALEDGHTTVADAVTATPGITVQRRGSGFESSTVRIRGSSAEQVLVLRDGQPVGSGTAGFADLSRLSLRGVEKIEVILGPATALYGAGGAAGAINLISKAPGTHHLAEGGLSVTTSAEYGSFGEFRLGGEVFAPLGASELSVAVDGAYAQNEYSYSRNGESIRRENAGGRQGAARLGLRHSFGSASLELRGSIDRSDRGIPGTVEFPSDSARLEETGVTAMVAFASGGAAEDGPGSLGAGPTLSEDGRWGTVSQLRGSREERAFTDPEYPLGALSSESTLFGVDAAFTARGPLGGGSVDLPVSYSSEALRESELGGRERLSIAFAPGYAAPRLALGRSSLGWRITGRVELVRTGEDYAFSEPELLPSLRTAVSWRSPGESVESSLAVGAGYRLPTYSELFWPAGAFAVGNPELEPERSSSVELELRLGRTEASELRLNTHLTWYREMIQWLPSPTGYWRPLNTGEAVTYGGEAAYRLRRPVGLSPWTVGGEVSGEILFARDRNEGPTFDKQLPYRPEYGGTISAELSHLLGHRLGVTLRGVGERPVTAQNTRWLDPYLAVDLAAGYTLPGTTVTLRGRVNNLLDQQFVETRFYPNPGRELVFGVEVTW
jgi:outer membrane cobalamin receptor